MTRFWEWLGRVIMLVLAGMITLSIIGAIASIPSASVQTHLGVEPQEWPQPRPVEEPAPAPVPTPAPTPGTPEPSPPQAAQPTGTQTVAVPQPRPVPTSAEWLEAITYALLALVGLAAVGILLLWRAVGHWRRSADALEMLAAREP